MGTLHDVVCKFMIISRSVLLIIRNISDKVSRVNQNTHFILNKVFNEILASCGIIWKTVVQPDRAHMKI